MKRGCPDHPKTIELAALLKIPRPYAVGLLELLFHFTAQYAPAGDIGRFSDHRIEGALFWAGRWCKPGTLIQAMMAARWIDHDPVHRLVVHDWAQHADQATARKLEREGRAFSAPARVNSD